MADTLLSNSGCRAVDTAALDRCYQELMLARKQLQQQQQRLRSLASRAEVSQ